VLKNRAKFGAEQASLKVILASSEQHFSPPIVLIFWSETADTVSSVLIRFDKIRLCFYCLHIGKSGLVSICCKHKEGETMMKMKRRYLYLNCEEARLVLQSLIRFKNKLQQQGRFTDCVDELILKVSEVL